MDKWSEHALHKRGYPMANKHIKKCLTGETPINSRLARIRKTNQTKCWQRCGATRTVMFWWRQYKLITITLEECLVSSTDTEYRHTLWSAIPLPSIYQGEMCSFVYQKTRTRKWTAAYSKQPKTEDNTDVLRVDKYTVIHTTE